MAQKKLSKKEITTFRTFIWDFYQLNKREFAWRNIDNPYYVVVSELMLQQTQTYRVESKFDQFITEFSDFEALAQAPLRDVLSIWQGLGYNRRGKYLQQIAQKVVQEYDGKLPCQTQVLQTLPGIGPYTAGSICAFAFNKPTVFIETNIRSVFIHSFFRDKQQVSDKQLLPLIAQSVDPTNPREWYYALMDYGVMLKKQGVNPSRKSKHYVTQSKFEGSDRQIRGRIVALLTQYERMTKEQLVAQLQKDAMRIERILNQLCKDEMIKRYGDCYLI